MSAVAKVQGTKIAAVMRHEFGEVKVSSISNKHKAMIEYLFDMQGGFFFGFTNRTFQSFMLLNADVDVYDAPEYMGVESKANKFRKFLEIGSDETVGKVLLALLQTRDESIDRQRDENDEHVDRYENYAVEIKQVAQAMCSGAMLPASNEDRLNTTLLEASRVLNDIIRSCETVCINQDCNYGKLENQINDYIRDLLEARGYSQIRDQSRHGVSSNGGSAGEVDLLLKKDDKEVAIVEGLKLASVDKAYIKEHIDKAIVNYNPLGTSTFIIAYAGAADFAGLWNRLYSYLTSYEYPIEVKRELKELVQTSAAIKCAEILLNKDAFVFPLYFLAVNIGR